MANTDKNPQNGLQGSSYLFNQGTSPNTRVAISQKTRILTPSYGNNVSLNQTGVLGTFSVSQSRNAEAVRGIGFGDRIAELVPGVQDPATANTERALLYQNNLWQSTGYAGGIDGAVRALCHHRWPFDTEVQIVFSSAVDVDQSAANVGYRNGEGGQVGQFDGGVKAVTFPEVTPDFAGNPGSRGHTAVIEMYEACWWTSYSRSFSKDSSIIMESGDFMVTDIHDFSSAYGEFLASGNDPTIGQLGSIRYAGAGSIISTPGAGIGGGGSQSLFSQLALNGG